MGRVLRGVPVQEPAPPEGVPVQEPAPPEGVLRAGFNGVDDWVYADLPADQLVERIDVDDIASTPADPASAASSPVGPSSTSSPP
jgi:hypothetical protein